MTERNILFNRSAVESTLREGVLERVRDLSNQGALWIGVRHLPEDIDEPGEYLIGYTIVPQASGEPYKDDDKLKVPHLYEGPQLLELELNFGGLMADIQRRLATGRIEKIEFTPKEPSSE